MKKLIFILFVLLAVETYGVYGASQVRRITYSCRVEIGPLCYAWQESAIGKLLGPERSKELEASLSRARRAFEEDFADKLLDAKKSGSESFDKALDDAASAAKKGLEKAKDALDIK